MKIFTLLAVVLTLFLFPVDTVQADPPSISADSALLIEQDTGQVVFEKNGFQPRPTASTTKVLTAIVALEEADLDEVVEVSENAAQTGGSSMWLRADEELTMEELLYGLMLPSGNDAAVAIAEHISGTVENFMEVANTRAEELGAVNTHFKNPHGLPDRNHFSTAYDLSLLSRYAFTVDHFGEIVGSQKMRADWEGHDWPRILYNTNRLLSEYSGADGVKTGYTDAAGHCMVASATRNGVRYIATVLHSDQLWRDAQTLLDHAFNGFERKTLYERGERIRHLEVEGSMEGGLDVVAGEDVRVVVPRNGEGDMDGELRGRLRIFGYQPPVQAGERMGYFQVELGGEELGRWPALAGNSISRRTPFRIFWNWFNSLVQTVDRAPLGVGSFTTPVLHPYVNNSMTVSGNGFGPERQSPEHLGPPPDGGATRR